MNGGTTPLRVIVGGGEFDGVNNPGWLSISEEELNLLSPQDWANKFAPASIDAILAEHVWEHLSEEEGLQSARLLWRYLKPGGYLRCAVPDGYFPDEAYQRIVQVGGPGPVDHPAATHRVLYNYRNLSALFVKAGFSVKLLEYHDEKGGFHFVDWNPEEGKIYRSYRFDHRNQNDRLVFASLIIDAIKPVK